MDEFSLIKEYFDKPAYKRKDVILGIGDDAAVTQIPSGQYLVTTTDTLLEGVHFVEGSDPDAIAHKAIVTNLSDLAAMGAEPAWLNLSLAVPTLDRDWLSSFSDKIRELSEYYSVQLVGGDTVKGSLAITITAQGFVPPESLLKRSGAQKDDWIFVTGTLGDAAAGLDILKNRRKVEDPKHKQYLLSRYFYPTPRVLAGTTLRRLASACIDISDGMLQDLRHIVAASDIGALIDLDKLPISEALGESIDGLDDALNYACTGGDDYELIFTVPEENRVSVETAMASYNISCTCIGKITGAKDRVDLRLNEEPHELKISSSGYQHF